MDILYAFILRPFIIYFLLFNYLSGFSQVLKTEAVYSNIDNEVYKIERKYFCKKDSSVLYFRLRNAGDVYIKQRYFFLKDTLVLDQEYGTSFDKNAPKQLFPMSNNQALAINDKKKTVEILYYKDDTLLGTKKFTKKEYANYELNAKISRVQKLVTKKLKASPDSLIKKETVRSYYLNNILVRAEWLNAKDFIYNIEYYKCSGSTYTATKIHRDTNSFNLYRLDTLSWNKDTSVLVHNLKRLDWNKRFSTRYEIAKTNLKMYVHDTLYKELDHLENFTFAHILEDISIFDDPLYTIDLLHLDREREKDMVFNKLKVKNDYLFDAQNRTVQQIEYKNETLYKKVVYTYH